MTLCIYFEGLRIAGSEKSIGATVEAREIEKTKENILVLKKRRNASAPMLTYCLQLLLAMDTSYCRGTLAKG